MNIKAFVISVICLAVILGLWIGIKAMTGLSDRALAVIVLAIPVVICLWEAYKACNNGKI